MDTKKQTRMTKQRQTILEEVRKLSTHPTADEIYEIVRKRLPRISLGTVYRNLDLLSAHGQVWRLEACGGQYRFDGNTDEHYHIRCTECGRVGDVDDVEKVEIDVAKDRVRDTIGYDITGHRLEFLGICPECKADAPPIEGGHEYPAH